MPASSYRIDLVIACYQEEAVLPVTIPAILLYMRAIVGDGRFKASGFHLILVDDGSRDATWSVIASLAAENPEIRGVKLSRNYGHQNAMLAGLVHSDADVTITLDADLQDDIDTIGRMLAEYETGCDLVLGVRQDRSSDTAFKRGTATGYYWLLSLLGVRIVRNHADFRLTSKRALRALLAHDEVNLFLRGVIPTIGFKTAIAPYVRKARALGETKYTLRKMLHLALDGITSFSIVPLRMITGLGGVIFILSLAVSAWIVWTVLFTPEDTVPGWASTTLPIFFLSGVQLLSIGIMGEYIGKIYMEAKRRPRFLVEETLDR